MHFSRSDSLLSLIIASAVLASSACGTKLEPQLGADDCELPDGPPELSIRLLPTVPPFNMREILAIDGSVVFAGSGCQSGEPIVRIRGIAATRHARTADMVLSVTRVSDGRVIAIEDGVETYGCQPQFVANPPLEVDLADDALDGTSVVVEYRVTLPSGEQASVSIDATIEWLGNLCDNQRDE